MGYFLLWCKLCLFVVLTTGRGLEEIVEKGSKTSIYCSYEHHASIVTVQVRGRTDFINVTICSLVNSTCLNLIERQFCGEVTTNEGTTWLHLTIFSARVNETEFRCLDKYHDQLFTLEVYERPVNPVCEPVVLDYTKKNLLFTCRAWNGYPSINASLYIRGADASHLDIINHHCSNTESGSAAHNGYSAECIWRVSAAKFEPLRYKYYVKMSPTVSYDRGIPDTVSQDYTLQLSSPQVAVDYDMCTVGPGVSNGHITIGSIASCRCVLETAGFPSGQARWYTLHGNQSVGRDDTTDGSSNLILQNETSGQSYQCRAESPLKTPFNWGPVYTPVFVASNSGPERHGLRIELVAGIVAGSVVLVVIIGIVVWKCRRRNRQSADTIRMFYMAPSNDVTSVSSNANSHDNSDRLLI